MRNEGVDDVFEAATRASMLVSAQHHSSGRGRRGSDASGESASGCRCVVC